MSVADSFSWSPRDYTCSVPMPSDLVTSRASRPKPSNTQADTSSCDGATSSTPEQVVVTWEYRQGSGDWADLSTSGLKLVCTCLHYESLFAAQFRCQIQGQGFVDMVFCRHFQFREKKQYVFFFDPYVTLCHHISSSSYLCISLRSAW